MWNAAIRAGAPVWLVRPAMAFGKSPADIESGWTFRQLYEGHLYADALEALAEIEREAAQKR